MKRGRAASSVHAFWLRESPLAFCAAEWIKHRVRCYSTRAAEELERKPISGAQHRRPQIGMPLDSIVQKCRTLRRHSTPNANRTFPPDAPAEIAYPDAT